MHMPQPGFPSGPVMAESAHIDSLHLLKDLRATLIGFAETARMALGEADSDIHRTLSWLTGQAEPHWRAQARKCADNLAQARDQLRRKSLYKTAGGGRASVVDEKIAVATAQRRLEEAQTKLKNVQRWKRQLEQEVLQYRGQVQAIQRTVEMDLPRAVALLDRVLDNLDAYVAVAAPRRSDEPRPDEAAPSMARRLAGDAPRALSDDDSAPDNHDAVGDDQPEDNP